MRTFSNRKPVRLVLFASAIAAITIAGAPKTTAYAADPAASPERSSFELMHLWLTPIEQPALSVLQKHVRSAGMEWLEHRVKGNFYGIQQAFAERMVLGAPPTALFWIGTIEPARQRQEALFRTIPQVKGLLVPELDAIVALDGAFDVLPLVIHLQNVGVVNKSVFERAGQSIPKTWREFLAMAPAIQAAGAQPIAVSEERWLFRFLFLSVFAEGLDKSKFELMINGRGERDEVIAHAKATFEILKALKKIANGTNSGVDWSGAIELVRSGAAALTITGDFAAPAFRATPDVSCIIAPGNQFVMWSFDVLAFPTMALERDRISQDRAIKALANRDALAEFARAKGGVPVVGGIKPAELDSCSSNSLASWTNNDKVLLSYDRWRLQLNSISSLALQFWNEEGRSPEDAAQALYEEMKALSE